MKDCWNRRDVLEYMAKLPLVMILGREMVSKNQRIYKTTSQLDYGYPAGADKINYADLTLHSMGMPFYDQHDKAYIETVRTNSEFSKFTDQQTVDYIVNNLKNKFNKHRLDIFTKNFAYRLNGQLGAMYQSVLVNRTPLMIDVNGANYVGCGALNVNPIIKYLNSLGISIPNNAETRAWFSGIPVDIEFEGIKTTVISVDIKAGYSLIHTMDVAGPLQENFLKYSKNVNVSIDLSTLIDMANNNFNIETKI